MEFSPEEKQKIYAEEKAKIETQEKLKKEQQQKNAKNIGIGCLTFIVILIILGIIGVNSNQTITTSTSFPINSSTNSNVSKNVSKPDLELLNVSSKSDEYYWYVIGTVKNNSFTKTYNYVQVEVNLYDKFNAQVGSTLANTNNLEPGGIWKFKAIVTDENAYKYKVKNVSGW